MVLIIGREEVGVTVIATCPPSIYARGCRLQRGGKSHRRSISIMRGIPFKLLLHIWAASIKKYFSFLDADFLFIKPLPCTRKCKLGMKPNAHYDTNHSFTTRDLQNARNPLDRQRSSSIPHSKIRKKLRIYMLCLPYSLGRQAVAGRSIPRPFFHTPPA